MMTSPQKGKLKATSIAFATQILALCDRIERKAILKQQLGRAATSIGANIHEAHYAESRDDFIHKFKIALKECHETEYWLTLLSECCKEHKEEALTLRNDAGAIRRMLIASINTIRNNTGL